MKSSPIQSHHGAQGIQLETENYILKFMDHAEDREEEDADSEVETVRGLWG